VRVTAPISVEEYLRTAYEPDCDYVDGEVLERNVGERDHSKVQRQLILFFGTRAEQMGIHVFPEQRIQISPRRFRIPDVCVIAGPEPEDQVFRTPPLICIEILSPEDSLSRMRQRIDDYLNFGAEHVWIVEPELRKGYICSKTGMQEPQGGVLFVPGTQIRVVLNELFAELDRA